MNKSFQQKISTFPIQLIKNMELIILMIEIGLKAMFYTIIILVINVIIERNLKLESESILITLKICISQEISTQKPSLEEFHFGRIFSVLGLMDLSTKFLSFLTRNSLKDAPELPHQKSKLLLWQHVNKLVEELTSTWLHSSASKPLPGDLTALTPMKFVTCKLSTISSWLLTLLPFLSTSLVKEQFISTRQASTLKVEMRWINWTLLTAMTSWELQDGPKRRPILATLTSFTLTTLMHIVYTYLRSIVVFLLSISSRLTFQMQK